MDPYLSEFLCDAAFTAALLAAACLTIVWTAGRYESWPGAPNWPEEGDYRG